MKRPIGFLLLILLALAGCDTSKKAEEAAKQGAVSIEHTECAACGMLVHKQPAPRAQVIHSDGTRKFLCSISDLMHYAEAPSPHGKIVHTYVEVMNKDSSPHDSDTGEHTWVEANDATYMVGVTRTNVMGPAAMTYRSAAEAAAAAERFNGKTVEWQELSSHMLGKVSPHMHE